MISKERMFIVAGNVDDSIKGITPVYDITIVPNFLEFEEFIDTTPIKIGTIIISANELQFTSVNMERLINLLNKDFLKLTGKCLYLIDNETDKHVVSSYLEEASEGKILCYQGDLSMSFISDIVDGTGRDSDESEVEVVTYRMRASEYIQNQQIKKYETDEEKYETDEENLAGIPAVEEPKTIIPDVEVVTTCYYVVGANSIERSLFTFLEAQYLALIGKVIFMESDVTYHTLTDMVTKSNVDYEYFDVEEFKINCSGTLERIKMSQNRIIFIGSKKRTVYDYNFMYDILLSNLENNIDFFIKECDFDQTPYGEYYNIVCEDTVPKLLECVNSLCYDVDSKYASFIGIRTRDLGPLNINSTEMSDMVKVLLQKEDLVAEVVSAYGINLKGDNFVYDLFSYIGRGNQRQG